jgi:hypothetical protein
MHDIVEIPISDLLLDSENPRLAGGSTTQQQTALALAKQQGDALITLADDIVRNGLDPTVLPAVVPTGENRQRYRVVEGNRRLLAIRALDTPSFVTAALTPSNTRKLLHLADRYAHSPLSTIPCALFDREEDARHWIELRHTGQNGGAGLVEWGAEEKDRFHKRHRGARKPAGQLIDFVERRGALSEAARASDRKILTNVERLLGTTYARERLGIDVVHGQVVTHYPEPEVLKGLTRVVDDLKTGKVSVPQLYQKNDRERYVNSLPRTALPKKTTRLSEPILLEDLTAGRAKPRKAAKVPPKPRPKTPPRTTVIPKSAQLNVTVPRINDIYNELLQLNAEQFPNACSVLLRVFLELSVDHVVEHRKLMSSDQMRNVPLAKRMKVVAMDLEKRRRIPQKLRVAVERIADGQSVLGPAIPTFNQYVHNEYVFPRALELYSAFDEILPLLAKLWP